MKFQTNDGVLLDYQIFGENNLETIILITGYSGFAYSWKLQVEALVNNGYRVITYDRRNHGLSQTVNYGMRIERHAMDLAELMQHLNVEKTILLGHSMGSSVIWSYLSLFGYSKVLKVITVDTSPKAINSHDWLFGVPHSTISKIADLANQIEHSPMTRLPINPEIKKELGNLYLTHKFDYVFNRPLLLDNLIKDWRDVIINCEVEQLFIGSSMSTIFHPSYAIEAAKLSEKATYAIIQNTGHLPHLEAPNEFNQIVLEFIN